uniref:Uncharacterized protein n=1 Tax=Rhizophora mucronata TaxID=61149 RepID=A0A2P2PA38_RHIMU
MRKGPKGFKFTMTTVTHRFTYTVQLLFRCHH